MLEKNGENREKIWVDLDETLCYTVRDLLEHHKITIWDIIAREEHITDYYIYKIPWINISFEEAVQMFREVFYKDFDKFELNPIEWAKERLELFSQKWHTLDIVTARDSHLFWEYTNKWLDIHFPNLFSQVHHANHFWQFWNSIPKSELCKQNWIYTMIEDNPDYAMELARNWIKTYLLQKAWNYHKRDKHENLIRVEHWWEIEI